MSWTDEQKDAIYKSGSNIIVSAGAGSGKTAVLTERVVEKIKSGTHINELLILTFTKLAAAEMKDRIRNKLSNYKDELNLLNSSYITTFDSYALSILKKYHYLLNISKDIEITDESVLELDKKRIFDELFDSMYLENLDDFNELIKKYCIKKDNNLRYNIMQIALSIDNMFDKFKYIDYIKNEFFENTHINEILNEYYNFLQDKKDNIIKELENLNCYFDSNYVDKMYESINGILTSDVKNLYLITNVSFPRLSGANDEQKMINNDFKLEVNELLSYSKFGSFESIKESIMSSRKDILTIISIVEKYLIKLIEYKKENNIYTFNDVATLSIKILNDHEDIREEVKSSFKEIMIDEYQDTNDVQEMFINLISNNNVYVVGDIKQAIYRFRGSNPSLFKIKYDNYSNNNGGIKIDLLKNFRSRNEVINNINEMFKLIMDDDIGGADYKNTHQMEYGNDDYDKNKFETNYNIRVLEYESDENKLYSDEEIEIFTIANDIKEKVKNNYKVFDKDLKEMRDIKYSDVSIILDTSTSFQNYKKVFEYLNIPLTVLRDESITKNVYVELFKNLIDIVIRINNNDYNTSFKFDFMSIGRSFLYEYTDEYLFEIFSKNKFKETLLYKELGSIKITNSTTCLSLFESILDIIDVYNKINKIGSYEEFNARINKIYEICKTYSNLGYDIYEFNDEFEEILSSNIDIKFSNNVVNKDSVRILTIHASKGLEYPICYFANLDHRFNVRDLNNKIIVDKKYGIMIPDENNENSIIKELYKNEFYKEELSEKIRLFYVALTRSRENIIIVVPSNEVNDNLDENGVIDKYRRLKYRKLSNFVYAFKKYYGKYFETVDIDSINLSKNYLYNKTKLGDLNKVIDDINVKEINIKNELVNESHFSKETIGFIDKDVKEKMDFGKKVHETLELLDFKNLNLNIISDEFIRNKIIKFLSLELFKNINNATIYQEYEFNYIKDNIEYNGVIDLIVEYSDYIDIVDYKLKNINDEGYKKQLLGYKSYIESISNKKVNIYLYSIIDEKIVKINE